MGPSFGTNNGLLGIKGPTVQLLEVYIANAVPTVVVVVRQTSSILIIG